MYEKTGWMEYRAEKPVKFFNSLWRKTLQLLARFLFINNLRVRLYRWMGVRIGSKVYMGMECFIDSDFSELLEIEDGVIISFRVIITCHDRIRFCVAPVRVRKDAFIGAGAIVLPGVEIGEGAVVGAGCVVHRDVPAGAVVVGNPMRIVKSKN